MKTNVLADVPLKRYFDRRGETGSEDIRRQFRIHGQEFIGSACGKEDIILDRNTLRKRAPLLQE